MGSATQRRGCLSCNERFTGLEVSFWGSGEAKGETIPLGAASVDFSLREPIGVVGAIIPWNAPMMLAALKAAPALAARRMAVDLGERDRGGNTVL